MYKLSAIEIRDRFLKGEISAVSIAEYFLNRIHSLDDSIGAFLHVMSDAILDKAKQLDQRKKNGKKLGKMAGIPVALKDNIQVKGFPTTCASKILANYHSIYDATVVKLLESEDALIIGKTNMDEFAMGSSTENSAFQKTYNPWNLKCSPGGSSGGSIAAVTARMCPLGLGSETGGSVRQPAALCGIVGFKPTYGRVSRYGLVAFGSSLDQISPCATRTADIGLIMEVVGQHCAHDSTSLPSPPEHYLDKMTGLLQPLTIGVPWSSLEGLAPEARRNFDTALDVMKGLGAKIVDVSLNTLKYSIAIYYILATAEASTNLARFDGIRYGHRSPHAETLDQVYDLSKEEGFGAEVKRRILLGTFVLSSGYQDAYYKQAQKVRMLMINEYKQAFQQCDIIATPVSPFPAFEIGAIHDPLQMYLADIYTIPASLAGLPAISVPSGFSSDAKPFGLQLTGPQRADVEVCRIAHAYEMATRYTEALPELVLEEIAP